MTARRKFMYYGWLPILELDGLSSDMVLRAYTWGLDLAAQNAGPSRDRQGADFAGLAGVGGPLAMQAPGAGPGSGDLDAVYTYDANGNVGQLVAWATGFGGAQGDEWVPGRMNAGNTSMAGNPAQA